MKGRKVALAVGSRGIKNLAEIVGATVDYLIAKGALPFIVPAMGSHGGATAAGQSAVLEGYGISESTMGVPVASTMDTKGSPIPAEVCPFGSPATLFKQI